MRQSLLKGLSLAALVACAPLVGLDDYLIDDGALLDASATGDSSSGSPSIDASIDGASAKDARAADAPLDCESWHARHFDPCTIDHGTTVTLPANATVTYDTDVPGFAGDAGVAPPNPPSVIIDQGGTPVVIISVDGFIVPVGTTLRVHGAKPLIIASAASIDVEGTIDVSSRFAEQRPGAGANPTACLGATAAAPGKDENTNGIGSGGGGGGAFGGAGGGGGPGDSGKENAGGAGGMKVTTPAIVRGGCPGAASGKAGPDPQIAAPSNANTVAPGGAGGGALQLSARKTIVLGAGARLLAGGAGGGGSPLHAGTGGGGGGSGGYIGFDAPSYMFAAASVIAANGGGGGGSGGGVATSAAPGSDARADTTPAPGTPAGSCSAQGGAGGAGTTLDGATAPQVDVTCGGAAGGGGVGYILLFGPPLPTLGGVFSPAPTIVP